ncbi:MAG: helix-turn-helix domain-containing protein, partial [Marmoricola sp.]
LACVMDGLRARGLLDADGRFTATGRATKDRVEALTDVLAEAPYESLDADELAELVALLEPISAALAATGSS